MQRSGLKSNWSLLIAATGLPSLVNAEVRIGLFSLVSAAVLYLAPLAFLVAPLLYRYINMNVIFMEVDTFAKSLLIMAVGVVLTAISFKLADVLAKKLGGYTRMMIRKLNQ